MSLDRLTVNATTHGYHIDIGAGAINHADYIKSKQRYIILADDYVYGLYGDLLEKKVKASGGHIIATRLITAGEEAKSFQSFQSHAEYFLEQNIDRGITLIAFGGGVIGDLGGFIASTLLRGIDYIQIPTTLLAQVDSAVGGKTGINTSSGKNLVGSFYSPKHVVIDTDFLKSLPDRQMIAGYAEIIKYGFIYDVDFYAALLEWQGQKILDKDPSALRNAIYTSCKIKAEIVSKDEKEQGIRAILNFGHSFGHAIEHLAGYDGRFLHGEAVSIGMMMAAELCVELDFISTDDLLRLKMHYDALALPTIDSLQKKNLTPSADSFIKAMMHDKKVIDGALHLILLKKMGQAYQTKDVTYDQLFSFLERHL